MVIICKSNTLYIIIIFYLQLLIIEKSLWAGQLLGFWRNPVLPKRNKKIRIYVAIHVLEPSCSWRSKSISFVIRTVPWLRTLNNWIRSIYNVQFFQLHVRGSELLYIKYVFNNPCDIHIGQKICPQQKHEANVSWWQPYHAFS